MVSRKSIDFGSFTYWKSNGAIASRHASNNADQSLTPPKSHREIGKRRRRRPKAHLSVATHIPENERASLVSKSDLEETRKRLVNSDCSAEDVSGFDQAAETFLQVMAQVPGGSEEDGCGEEGVARAPRNAADVEQLEYEKQLLLLVQSYEQEVSDWGGALDDLARRPGVTAGSNEGEGCGARAAEVAAEAEEVDCNAREALEAYRIHADEVMREMKVLEYDTKWALAEIKTVADGIYKKHIKSYAE